MVMTTTPALQTIGVLGAGRMGQPIIGHLARNDKRLVNGNRGLRDPITERRSFDELEDDAVHR